MDNGIRVGHFLADGSDIFLPLGFIPDYFRLCDIDSEIGNSAVTITEWFERMEDDEAAGSQEGWTFDLATISYVTLNPDGQGITAYNTGSQSPTVEEWTQARGNAATARSATAPGTFIKATVGALNNTGQVTDREAIFECVAAGSSASSEPTWPSAIGEQVVDSSVTWEMVNEAKLRIGYQGVGIAGELQTNSHEYYYLAIRAHDSVDHGDVDGWASGVDQDWS